MIWFKNDNVKQEWFGVSHKVNIYLPYDPRSNYHIVPQEKNFCSQKIQHTNAYSSIIQDDQNWKRPQCPCTGGRCTDGAASIQQNTTWQ